MSSQTFTCEKCGTKTTVEYDDCGGYSSLFNEREERSVTCSNRTCREVVGTIYEY